MYLFDLHCDTLTEVKKDGAHLINQGFQLSLDHLKGERWCQCFAIFVPDTLRGEAAMDFFEAHVRFFQQEMARFRARVEQVRTAREIEQTLKAGRIAAVLTVEGGGALGGELLRVRRLAQCGVRMLTLTWNGENELASGQEAQGGLKPFGRLVIRRMEQEGIVADVSHLNDEGFWELARFAYRPFVASHSNARAVCAHPRNLTDEQIRYLVRSGGLIGMNYYPRFLSGAKDAEFSHFAAHVEHFIKLGAQDILALGSDFDGASMPTWLKTAAKTRALREQMCERFGQQLTDKIFFENAMHFFRRYDAEKVVV